MYDGRNIDVNTQIINNAIKDKREIKNHNKFILMKFYYVIIMLYMLSRVLF